jgi:hypothetical protein
MVLLIGRDHLEWVRHDELVFFDPWRDWGLRDVSDWWHMKSTSKKQVPPTPKGPSKVLLGAAAVLFMGALAYVIVPGASTDAGTGSTTGQEMATAPTAGTGEAVPASLPPDPPPTMPAKKGAKGALPPLPVDNYPAPRPPDVIRAAYEFAARHPEVLQYVPCFCGCQQFGHQGNDDCFVAERDADGNVTWDPHGMSCTICVDVAHDAMLMKQSGASVADIRRAIEQKYAPRFPTKTHTPAPPADMP